MKAKISIIATLLAGTAYAQDVIELPPLTYSADFSATSIDHTGAQVEVFEGDDIAKNLNIPVSEFLGQQAGVSVSRAGPIGSNTAILIRGTRQYENKVFIDGIDVTDPSLIQSYYNFANLTMADIERIEIVKGSQSAIYGGNAVGGVVNITTKSAPKTGWNVDAAMEVGSYNSFLGQWGVQYLSEDKKWEVSIANASVQSEGFSAADEKNGNSEADGFSLERWKIGAKYHFSDALSLEVSAFNSEAEAEYDGYDYLTYLPTDAENLAKTSERGGRVSLNYNTSKMSNEISYSLYDVDRSYEEDFSNYQYSGQRSKLAYAGGYDVLDNLKLNFRAEHSIEDYQQSGDYGDADKSAEMNSVAFGVNYSPIDALTLDISVRNDEHELFGAHTSYRAAAAYRVLDDLTLKASYGTGYRAPSLYEAHYGATQNLQPETSTSYDLGVEYNSGQTRIGANYFNIETDNLVEYAGTWPNDYYQNVEGISTRNGYELFGELKIGENYALHATYTAITTEDDNGERLTNIPAQEWTMGASAAYAGFSLRADLKNVTDVLGRDGMPLDDYSVVNARIGYAIGDGEFYVRGENLLDEKYETTRGYGMAGRSYYVGYQTSF